MNRLISAFLGLSVLFTQLGAMQPHVNSITLNLSNTPCTLPLQKVINHITRCQPIKDMVGATKIIGFHHYAYQEKQPYKTGTVSKITPLLWVYTQGDPDTFHTGYIIYKGITYSSPKTFFPCSWSVDQVIKYIQQQTNYHLLSTQTINPIQTTTTKKWFKFLLHDQKPSSVPLQVILEQNVASTTAKIITLYPCVTAPVILDSVLQALLYALAEKQKTALTQTHTETHKNLAPELFQAITENQTDKALALIASCADVNELNNDKQTALMLAAKNGNWNVIAALLEHNADIHAVDTKGNTALFYAVGSGDIYSVLALLDAQEINKPNTAGITPLIHAITSNNPEIVDTLLAYGADPNRIDNAGFTPLMHTIRVSFQSGNNLDYYAHSIALLLSYKANPNIQHGTNGSTVLMDAIQYGGDKAAEIVKLLLSAHADYHIKNNNQQTALTIAQNNRFTTIVSLLQNYITEQHTWIQDNQSNELMYALHTGNNYKAQQLLASSLVRTYVNAIDDTGNTALSMAISKNNQLLVTLLLDAGADTTIQVNGKTIYQHAQEHTKLSGVIKQRVEQCYTQAMAPVYAEQYKQKEQQNLIAAQKLAHKKNILSQFKQEADAGVLSTELLEQLKPLKNTKIKGWPLVLYAVKQKLPKVVEQLISLSIDMHATTDDGQSSFSIAWYNQDFAMLALLVRQNCLTTLQLQHIFDYALQHNITQLLTLTMQSNPALTLQALVTAIKNNNKANFDILVILASVSLTRSELETCILEAAKQPNCRYIIGLLALDHELYKCVNSVGQTPLVIAALADNVTNVVTLCKAGAQISDIQHLALPTRIEQLVNNMHERIKQQETLRTEQQKIIDLQAQGYTSLMLAAHFDDAQAIADDTSDGMSINNEGVTALIVAVQRLNNNAIDALLKKFKSLEFIDQKDTNGYPALLYAIVEGNIHAFKALVDRYCTYDYLTAIEKLQPAYKTALSITLTYKKKNAIFILRYLADVYQRLLQDYSDIFFKQPEHDLQAAFAKLPDNYMLKEHLRCQYYLRSKGKKLDTIAISKGFSLSELINSGVITADTIAQNGKKSAVFTHCCINSLEGLDNPIIQEALRDVEEINFGYNFITHITHKDIEHLAQLKNLKTLLFYQNQIETVSESLTSLTNLTWLDLSRNRLVTIPACIGNLTQLTKLELHHNRLEKLPSSLWTLPQLTQLQIDFNNLQNISSQLGKLKTLRILCLSHNPLESLPKALWSLHNLTCLSLGNLSLTALPLECSKLVNLNTLWLDNNKFKVFPKVLTTLVNLRLLSIERNQLDALPTTITELSSLEYLLLSANNFTLFPKSVCLMPKLVIVHLDNNGITYLPEIVTNQKLTYNLKNNLISAVPQTWDTLIKNQQLLLEGNPIKDLHE